jgi:hypothetical protein
MGGCPLPAAQQRDLGVDEASKVCDRQAVMPAVDRVQRRARPICALTGGPADHGASPWSPSAAGLTDRRPKRDAIAPQVPQTLR